MASIYDVIRAALFRQIFPAQVMHKPGKGNFEELHQNFYKQSDSISINNVRDAIKTSSTPYNIDVDTAIISKKKSKQYDPSQSYVIRVEGSVCCYEESNDFIKAVLDDEINIVVFNPPGVGHSPGVSHGPEDLQNSLKCVIEHLHNKGIPYENIILSGYSLGGGIATVVAADYQKNGNRIKLINDRSYADLSTAIADVVKNYIPTKFLRSTIGNLVYFAFKQTIRAFNLNVDAHEGFMYIHNKNPNDAHCTIASNDLNIPENASLYHSLDKKIQNDYGTRFATRATSKETPHFANYFYLTKENDPDTDAATDTKNLIQSFSSNFNELGSTSSLEKINVDLKKELKEAEKLIATDSRTLKNHPEKYITITQKTKENITSLMKKLQSFKSETNSDIIELTKTTLHLIDKKLLQITELKNSTFNNKLEKSPSEPLKHNKRDIQQKPNRH